MPFVVSATQAAEGFPIAGVPVPRQAGSTAMEKLLFSASFVPQAKLPSKREQARGEYKLTYLHSKAGTFSLAEDLMD